MCITLYTSRIVLQQLGVVDYGLYSVIGGIVTMFSFLNGALGAATSRFITVELGRKDYVRLNKIFNVALISHIIIAFVIVLLAETVGLWFLYNKLVIPEGRFNAAFWIYQISILTTVFTLTQVPYNATIIGNENMKIYAYVGVVEGVAKLVIAYLLTIAPFDKLIFYALLIFVLQIGVMLFYRYYCNKNYNECRLSLCREKPIYKEMISYASYDLIGNISGLAQGQGLNILLNLFFGPAVNAARGVAYQVQGAVTQFSNNFMTAVKPQIIKKYTEGNVEGMMDLVELSSCFSFYLMWLISFPIFLEAEYILRLWLGEYPEYSPIFLRLILVVCLIQTIKTPRTTVYHATGNIRLVNIVVGLILCATLPLAYIFLKLGWSPQSVFYASITSMIISEIVSVMILKRYIKFSISRYIKSVYLRCLLVVAVSFIIPYLSYQHTYEEGFIRLIITCIITSSCVLLSSFVVGMNREFRSKVMYVIKSKIRK